MDRLPETKRRRAGPPDDRNSKPEMNGPHRTGSMDSSGLSGPKRHRTAYIDDIVTYIHIGLLTMTTESKPPGVHWWTIAFQLAKEYKLNRDPDPPSNSTAQFGTHLIGPQGTPNSHDHTTGPEHGEDTSGATSPMSVVDDAIVESSDPRPVVLSLEENEERRRIWWTLYVFDR